MRLVANLLLIIFALVGLADSSYITYEKLSGQTPPCSAGSDCGAVLNSPWASIGPIPLAALGMLYYSSVLILALLWYFDFDLTKKLHPIWQRLQLSAIYPLRALTVADVLLGLGIFGFAFSLYLVSVMAFLIGSWCQYCLLSALTCSLIFLTILTFSVTKPASSLFWKHLSALTIGWLYRNIAKRVFFLIDPEFVHDRMTLMGRLLGSNPVTRFKVRLMLAVEHPNLPVKLAGITFPNRVGLSAGFDYDGYLAGILPSVGFGWHTIGTITLMPYEGNPKPRLGRLPSSKALIVNKGLKSQGAATVIARLHKQELAIPTFVSIASSNQHFSSEKQQITDILGCFMLFEKSALKHHGYELNISCPNTFGGEPFTTPNRLAILLSAIDGLKLSRPVFLKMPIDQSTDETKRLLTVAAKHRVAGVIFGNLTKDHQNPAVTKADQAIWQNRKGNLSGRPTWDRSNAHIKTAKQLFPNRFVIVGTGGIFSAADARKKLELGADLVQLITGLIYQGPQLIGEINRELAQHPVRPSTQTKSHSGRNRANA